MDTTQLDGITAIRTSAALVCFADARACRLGASERELADSARLAIGSALGREVPALYALQVHGALTYLYAGDGGRLEGSRCVGSCDGLISAEADVALVVRNADCLPVVIVATREAIRAIPAMIREGSMAVGATRWQTCRYHIIPYAMPGILTGVIIGLARAIGETAPIITIGALTFIAFLPPAPFTGEPPAGLFDWVFAPFTVMPIQIFNWTSRPDPAFEVNAAAAAFVLMVMVLSMNAVAIYLRYTMRKKIKW